ncbi:MAG: hypothetical protein GAK43_01309 [Stenotrophomonas maltophilia]|nr:MAG: hypothetical protein GAK43_01309 [Stenotrophomonas maltophilia]
MKNLFALIGLAVTCNAVHRLYRELTHLRYEDARRRAKASSTATGPIA